MTLGSINIGRVGIWTWVLDHVPSSRSVELAAEAEELGYGAIWYPEAAGRDPFVVAALLLQGTSSMKVAPGIANIYARDPVTTANAQRTIEEAFPGRFLLGLGVSHQHLVQGLRKHDYSRPLSYMREYLVRMGEAPFFAHGPQELPEIVLAALGPKMLQLSAEATAGAHPYFVPTEHTAVARQTMGPDAALCPEQMVILDTDPVAARTLARESMALYLRAPNYTNNLRRLGFEQSDIDGGPGGGPSDRLVDAIVGWGTPEQIAARVQEHFDAGADHVSVQVLADGTDATVEGWRILAPYLLT
ncbi:MAG: TIGR03620 family F420-dependent LLM class oxidoreductase [Acidimicrobiaceae bacterium]|nr:TIGR03620 family F420-dependent LLM class oxidoreductase [Acidimicrobiaceae bacterium]MYG99063.1 TIGR03620 family F420-dependent LLM class oxidoreductase [Acidimicrobiaceae bacterium]MYL04920.1 TIGR03620 family F420-dependent LLM class oxidoreductase [Acidimicrobiaceae bacterium]